MTCIVGITDGKRIVMGGDSAGSYPENPELYSIAIDKIFAVGPYLVGIRGSYRAGQLARWEMKWPDPPEPGADLESFMVRAVVPALREIFRQVDPQEKAEPSRAAQFLIGLHGQLYTVGPDLVAGRLQENWICIGSGRLPAYGALHAMADLELELEEKVRRALAAAQNHTANVREPFQLLSVG